MTTKVIKHVLNLISQGYDCSCEYQHSQCNAMSYGRGVSILRNLEDSLKKKIKITDKVLETEYDKYCHRNDIITKLEKL